MIRYEIWPNLICLIASLREEGSWCGATHIQKAVYIAQELASVDFELKFLLYHHGPFSFDLRDALDELEAAGGLEPVSSPPYGPRYEVTDAGYGFWGQFEDQSFSSEPLEFVAKKLGKMNVAELEKLGTALLVKREIPDADEDSKIQRLVHYKPHVTQTEAAQAFRTVAQWQAEWTSLRLQPC